MWQIGRCVRPLLGRRAEVRGGSWNNNRDHVRCANRNRNTPHNRNNNVGFRCANTRWRPIKMPQSS
ncbi:MAG: SUMF1/EgtB/PvdO family nonheme iron enzyme [Anaerolineales bacterium]|nr:SUMF1/EgtB/PvdO family nonheme iron enzyme [Anaerolineales bacterium]MCB8952458.1 SUMF1/EgtB/PvdO family nonheme iron enzyme [Ardenticatenales bacterium]